ncbi:MAG: hypothetical protein LBN36_07265 [Clostridiales Family XIII bacterium]|jgi:ABC-type molybdate transport system substrate-binding protein|nr:hypothetical protein [Clostridiales Family XIII bacterium]
MGLFSDTKKFFYGVIINYPTFEFDQFSQTFADFLNSEKGKKILKDNGFSFKGELNLVKAKEADYETTYKLVAALAPDGDMTAVIREKGPNQGLALTNYTLYVNATLKKTEKRWIYTFYEALHQYYEDTFDPNKEKKGKMFLAIKKL